MSQEWGADESEVTIILPTLNERHHIRDCLDSLLAQDYSEIREIWWSTEVRGNPRDREAESRGSLARQPEHDCGRRNECWLLLPTIS